MFHGKKFLKNIESKGIKDSVSKYVPIDAGHWMVHQNLDAVMKEMKLFMQSTDKMMQS